MTTEVNRNTQLLKSILNRNGFDLTQNDELQSYAIVRKNGGTNLVKIYMYLAVITAIAGILCFLFVSVFIGTGLFVASVPMYRRADNMNLRQKHSKGRFISFNETQLKIQEGDKNATIKKEDLVDFKYDVDKNDKITVGTVSAITKNQHIEIIEIFGTDKRYVEDDVKTIADKMSSILN